MEVWELREGFGLEHLRKAKRLDPAPGPGDVLLMMQAALLNYRDTLVVRGGYGPRYTLPLIPVSDGVGEVVAVGEGIARVRVGDRVCPISSRAGSAARRHRKSSSVRSAAMSTACSPG